MTRWLDGLKTDVRFLQTHTLQPKWFKVLKVFILAGFLVGYGLIFGITKTILFAVIFIGLSAVVHFTYRFKTHTFQQSWLDFQVYEENGVMKYQRIGMLYYAAVIFNGLMAFLLSQWMAK